MLTWKLMAVTGFLGVLDCHLTIICTLNETMIINSTQNVAMPITRTVSMSFIFLHHRLIKFNIR